MPAYPAKPECFAITHLTLGRSIYDMGYRINYARVVSQANTIAECAQELSAQSNQLNMMEQRVRSAWKGPASETFLSRVLTLRGEVDRTRQQMANLAATIRQNADRIQREDEEAQRRAAALR